MAGTLYVVATPIGNLEDVTLRALRVLREVELIAAEDTRHSRKLLDHYGIDTRLVSYHDHSERAKAPGLVRRLVAGEDIALISDAGTPGIADPGYRLVVAAIEAGVKVVPIPGASALVACVSVSGLPTDRFTFEGFVPARSAARKAFYERIAGERATVVCYEAGRRLADSLRDLAEVAEARPVVVCREVSKMYEAIVRGSASDLAERVAGEAVRGEVTLLVGGAGEPQRAEEAEVRALVTRLRREGKGMKEVSRQLAEETGWSPREIYRLGLTLAE